MFEAIQLKTAEVKDQEEAIRLRVRELDDEPRKRYHQQFGAQMKDPDTYAVLNFFFITGIHHMYLGKILRGCVNLLVLVTGIVMFAFGLSIVGIILICFILAVELMALFRSQIVVTHHNNQLSEKILNTLAT